LIWGLDWSKLDLFPPPHLDNTAANAFELGERDEIQDSEALEVTDTFSKSVPSHRTSARLQIFFLTSRNF
jgi:hypothetical protein